MVSVLKDANQKLDVAETKFAKGNFIGTSSQW